MSQTEEESLEFNDPDEIESPDDITLPKFAHHLKIRSELNKLAEREIVSWDEADELFDQWRADRQ